MCVAFAKHAQSMRKQHSLAALFRPPLQTPQHIAFTTGAATLTLLFTTTL
jgi:hypothetical protein